MACLRCGKPTEENQVFCPECLEVMESQPVKPDTPIQIPNRERRTTQKHPKHQSTQKKWADKVFRLRYTVFGLVLLIIVLALALALCVCVLFQLTPQWFNDLLADNTPYQIVSKLP